MVNSGMVLDASPAWHRANIAKTNFGNLGRMMESYCDHAWKYMDERFQFCEVGSLVDQVCWLNVRQVLQTNSADIRSVSICRGAEGICILA